MRADTRRRRILVIDDSAAIHMDFRRLLSPEHVESDQELEDLEASIFGSASSSRSPTGLVCEVDSAFQGREGLDKAREALAAGAPYELIFLDYLMPPGWSGVETLRELRKVQPAVPVVICSAYSDYSWEELTREFGADPFLAEMRKPFQHKELYELTRRLTQASP